MVNRDDFSQDTKSIIAERVHYFCSNPDCHKQTIGPHSNKKKRISIGKASHICAAAPGGKRYNAKMSIAQRKAPENGIWLCSDCATLIDTDEIKYSRELLLSWKSNAEKLAENELGRPSQLIPKTTESWNESIQNGSVMLKNNNFQSLNLIFKSLKVELANTIRDARTGAGENRFLEDPNQIFVDPSVEEFLLHKKLHTVKGGRISTEPRKVAGIHLLEEYCRYAKKGPLLILGDMGVGKSTLLTRFELVLLDDIAAHQGRFEGRIPVYLKAAEVEFLLHNATSVDFKEPNLLYQAFYWLFCKRIAKYIPPEVFTTLICEGHFIFLVDGIDEIPYNGGKVGGRSNFVDIANDFVKIGTNKVIYSCRGSCINDCRPLIESGMTYVLSIWEETQILHFLTMQIKLEEEISLAKANDIAKHLWDKILAAHNLGDLCHTPFLLKTITNRKIIKLILKAPEIDRVKIYEILIKERIKTNSKRVQKQISYLKNFDVYEFLWRLCKHIACEVMASPEREVLLEPAFFMGFIKSSLLLNEEKVFLQNVVVDFNSFADIIRINLLFDISLSTLKLRFRHQSIAEYLMARTVRDEFIEGKSSEHFIASNFTLEALDFLFEIIYVNTDPCIQNKFLIAFILNSKVSLIDPLIPWALLKGVYQIIDRPDYDIRLDDIEDRIVNVIGTNWKYSQKEIGEFLAVLVQYVPQLMLEGLHPDFHDVLNSLTDTEKIKKLNFSYCRIQKIPECIWQLKSLESLDLSGDGLSLVSEDIGQLQLLKNLYLGFNDLSSLPKSICQLISLNELDLFSNGLSSLPEGIGQLKSLKTLWLLFNSLSIIPDSIGQLRSLEELDLDGNQLTFLPDAIGQLISLKKLSLGENNLSSLPNTIGDLKSLEILNLSRNKLTTIPDSITHLKMLKELRIDGNFQLSISPLLEEWIKALIENGCKTFR